MNGISDERENQFIKQHCNQLVSSDVPEVYWPTVYRKITNEIFDAGEKFHILKIEYEGDKENSFEPSWALQALKNLSKTDGNNIFLIDHAWSFRVSQARNQLFQFESLRKRLSCMLNLNIDLPKEELVNHIFHNIWKICRCYSIKNVEQIEDSLPVWYVMDEIGSALTHSDTPNCRVIPFIHVDTQMAYSLLYPTSDLNENDFVSVDFAEFLTDEPRRQAALLPWCQNSFSQFKFKPETPGADYFLSGHVEEQLPDNTKFIKNVSNIFKVYTEYELIKQFLTHTNFVIVDNENEADILWYTTHFKNFLSLSQTGKYVNQFPFEYVVTVKDLLSLTCRKFLDLDDDSNASFWFPATYNLNNEIGNFLSYFQYREDNKLENFWIIKPYNLARSLDIHITDNLNYIMRLPLTGPKIAQKYITNPVLFNRDITGLVKFDIRYVVLLECVDPLKVYVYKEFFLRFANKPFALTNFDDYETHFTVMNYDENIPLKHMLCSTFKSHWSEQYSTHPWNDVEQKIVFALKSAFECAVKDKPPCGIGHCLQSRAVYAADLMLAWDNSNQIQPKLLEINWTPDCKRACDYYPDFYNHIFGLLFLNEFKEYFHEL